MKKVLFTVLLLILLLASTACADENRWSLCGIADDGEAYYIDRWTVEEVTKDDITRFWVKRVVSAKSRNIYIAKAKSKKEKKWLSQLFELKECKEISLKNNTIRTIAQHAYDLEMRVIHSFSNDYTNWDRIVPDSVGEMLRNKAAEIINIINIMKSTFPRY